jgi:hypothetical protein
MCVLCGGEGFRNERIHSRFVIKIICVIKKTRVCNLAVQLAGTNRTTVSYNASAVKIYNSATSQVLFVNTNVKGILL